MKLTGLGQYAKFWVAVAGQALVYAQATYGTDNKWVEIATAAAAALAVFAVPNAAKPVVHVVGAEVSPSNVTLKP